MGIVVVEFKNNDNRRVKNILPKFFSMVLKLIYKDIFRDWL